jgi:hypothetical protein
LEKYKGIELKSDYFAQKILIMEGTGLIIFPIPSVEPDLNAAAIMSD